jgi:DNA (cytosine-5)-methyltransferase 1
MKPLRHASLFSGIGAAEIAAEMLGWENISHCEINPFGRKVLEYWFPNSHSYEDITKTDFSQYRGQIDVLSGGFPCQPFSYAGKRGGENDDRYLWQEMLRVVDQVRPMWVIGENVNGITTMVESYSVIEMGCESSLFNEGNGVHRYRAEQTFTIERVCRDLESKGYSVQPMLVPACAVGAPHRRDRIFILAYNVADSDSGNDLRETGEYEGESREERLSQRNEVRKPRESSHVRCEIEGVSSDTYSNRGGEIYKYLQSEFTNGAEFICDGRIRNVTDSGSKGLEGKNKSRSKEGGEWVYIWRDIAGCYRKDSLVPRNRWKGFPTISPVHRGNDGFPFDVDNLTIPFAKWRTESLKAYGNAIVPQVIYQIMKCINEISTNQ